MDKLILSILLFLFCNSSFARTIIVSSNNDISQQFRTENTIYVINNAICLNGVELVIPKNSVLRFNRRGEFLDGTILCNNTLLKGCIKVDRIKGTLRNSSFNSSFSSRPCDGEKLKMLLNLTVDSLILDEDYVITGTNERIITSIPSIVGKNIQINIFADVIKKGFVLIPDFFIVNDSALKEFKGISFDFHNHICKGSLFAGKTDKKAKVSDIHVHNIDIRGASVTNDSYITGVNVTVSNGSSLLISNTSIMNLSSMSDGIIGNSGGNISAIYVSSASGSNSHVLVSNCLFEEIHNYSNRDEIITEDTNGLYVHFDPPCSSNCSIRIKDIIGKNFGKRLIKTDCANVYIENVVGTSITGDTMSLISINNGKGCNYNNAVVKRIEFKGVANYVVGSGIPNTIIDGLKSIITDNSSTYSSALFPMSSCYATNLELYGAQQIAFVIETNDPIRIKNVKYDDTMYSHIPYQLSAFITSNARLYLDNIDVKTDKLRCLFVDNYPNNNDYDLNVDAILTNLHIHARGSAFLHFCSIPSSFHSWKLCFYRVSMDVDGPFRGLLNISTSDNYRNPIDVSMNNVRLYCKGMADGVLDSYGTIKMDEFTNIELMDVLIDYHSRIGNTFHSLRITNSASEVAPVPPKVSINRCFVKSSSGKNTIRIINTR